MKFWTIIILAIVAATGERVSIYPDQMVTADFGLSFMIISLITTLASTAMSMSASREQAKQAEYNAEYDADVAEKAAAEEKSARAAKEVSERKQSRRRLASMEAKYAKSGLLMTGTPTLMVTEQAKTDELNILQRNRFSSIRAQRLQEGAGIRRAQGSFESGAYNIQGTSQLLSGVGSAASTGASYGLQSGGKTNSPITTNGAL